MKKEIDGAFIRERINQLRQSRKLSEKTLSELLGLNPAYLNTMNREQTIPSINVINAICDYFCITVSDFFRQDFANTKSKESLFKLMGAVMDNEDIDLFYDYLITVDIKAFRSYLKSFPAYCETKKNQE